MAPLESSRSLGELPGELGCSAASRSEREHLPVGMRQPVLGERRLHRTLDAPVDAADPVDDPLDLEVDLHLTRQHCQPFQEAVDVVFGGWGHAPHLDSKSLDVKRVGC